MNDSFAVSWTDVYAKIAQLFRVFDNKGMCEANIRIECESCQTSFSFEDVMAALPGRSWHSIANKSQRLHLPRDTKRRPLQNYRLWQAKDERRLKTEYENGVPVAGIASDLGRSVNSIQVRAAKLRLKRNKSLTGLARKDNKPILFQESSSYEGGEDSRDGGRRPSIFWSCYRYTILFAS